MSVHGHRLGVGATVLYHAAAFMTILLLAVGIPYYAVAADPNVRLLLVAAAFTAAAWIYSALAIGIYIIGYAAEGVVEDVTD